jgi:hypothetical protein
VEELEAETGEKDEADMVQIEGVRQKRVLRFGTKRKRSIIHDSCCRRCAKYG